MRSMLLALTMITLLTKMMQQTRTLMLLLIIFMLRLMMVLRAKTMMMRTLRTRARVVMGMALRMPVFTIVMASRAITRRTMVSMNMRMGMTRMRARLVPTMASLMVMMYMPRRAIEFTMMMCA